MAEWLKAVDCKSVVSTSGVRLPPSSVVSLGVTFLNKVCFTHVFGIIICVGHL